MTVWRQMQQCLDELSEADLLRRERVVDSACGPRVVVRGREVTCLCTNDYLGLAADPAVRDAAVRAIRRWGVGAGASRLVSGTTGLHVELERRLAEFKRSEAAVVTPTGWTANHAAVHALAGAGDLILCDKLNHASILEASRSCGARLGTFPHRDTDRLERLLKRRRGAHRRCLIATDSLFSMDGDFAPLRRLVEIKDRFEAQLLIDEAHATGVIGSGGRGVAERMDVEDRIDATVGTLSKALGTLGGFVAGPAVLIETIRNTARAYIYTTALPAAICAAAVRSLEIVRDQPERRRRLLAMADDLRGGLHAAGIRAGESESQIVPIVLGPAGRTLEVSRRLLERGFFVPAIRPPSVPRGASRLRVSLSAAHDPEDLRRFVATLPDLLARAGSPAES